MKSQKQPSPSRHKLGVKARAYRHLQNQRAVFMSIMLVAAATVLVILCKPQGKSTLPRPNNWGETRAFSAANDPKELLKVFRASYTAHQLYVLRSDVAKPLTALDHAFDNVRSEAELRSAMLQLFAATKDRFGEMIDASKYDTIMALRAKSRIGIGVEFAFDEEVEKPTLRLTLKEGEIEPKHGLEEKDIVLRIDGQDVESIPDFDKKSDGPVGKMVTEYANLGLLGSKVKLTVLRDSAEVEVELTRHIVEKAEPFQVHNMMDPSIRQGVPEGQIIDFATLANDDAPKKFAEALTTMTKNGIKGVIVDVSSVNGGDPEVAMRIAAMLMDQGVIGHRVEVTESGDVQMLTWEAKDGGVILRRKGPMAVSADGKLAKASTAETVTQLSGWQSGLWKGDVIVVTGAETRGAPELIAAAMKTQAKRGPIVGERTAGKGMAQSHFNVGDDTIIGITTGYYLAPNGTSIQDNGVVPTVQSSQRQPAYILAQYLMAQRFKLVPMPKYPE
jgi:C-terminal processing protease CtpA/Prc